jgi:GT2 family glycosyltransferase
MAHNPAAALIAGRSVDAQGHPSLSLSLESAACITRTNYLQCGNSNGLFFRREVFSTIGHFDVRLGVGATSGFHSGEESDIVLRALDAGLAARYFPDIEIHHDQVDAAITDAQLRRARGYGLGFGALLRKHRFARLHVAYRVSRPLARCVLCLLLRKPQLARYKWTWARAIAEGHRRWPAEQAALRPLDTP